MWAATGWPKSRERLACPDASVKRKEAFMKSLQRVSDTVNRTVSYVGIAVFLVLILACVMQVFFRFVLNHSLSWTEELARYCFIWMHMLGASLLIEGSGHATVTAVLDLFHGAVRKAVDVLIELVSLPTAPAGISARLCQFPCGASTPPLRQAVCCLCSRPLSKLRYSC